MATDVSDPTAGDEVTVYSVTTPDEKFAVFDPWNIPPTMRLAHPLRGAKLIWVTTFAEPKSNPAQAPFALLASKKVDRLPSKALAATFPLLAYEPAVPMTVPVSRAVVVCG